MTKTVSGTTTIEAQYGYDPYGIATKLQGSQDADFQYAGYYMHAPSGLNMPVFRAYSSSLGRFINRDPIGENGGVNLYVYVGSNPVNWVDPFGLSGWLSIASTTYGKEGLTEGHSWLAFKKDGSAPNDFKTYGTYGNRTPKGYYEDLEKDINPEAARTIWLSDAQEARLRNFFDKYKALHKKNKGWEYWSPCSTFAAKGWKAATGEIISPGFPSHPGALRDAIIKINGGANSFIVPKLQNFGQGLGLGLETMPQAVPFGPSTFAGGEY